MTDAPQERPSRPSARFTALLVPVMMTQNSTIARTVGRASHWMSRRNETWVDAGVLPRSSASACHSASTPNTTETTVWPITLARPRRPMLFCWLTFR
jgi:hypothetical protein